MALKIPPLLLLLLFALVMYGLEALYPLAVATHWRVIAALVLVLLGLVFAGAGVWGFKQKGTTVNPLNPEQANSLVTGGIYRISRNPMYVGFAVVLGAWALYLGNPLNGVLWLGFVLYLNVWQILPEERILRELFGEAFDRYCQKVRRWL